MNTSRPPTTKRVLDVCLVLLASVIAVPLTLAAATAVRLTMGRGVLFRQRRAGMHGRPIEVFKLRTMTNERSAEGTLLADEQRLTRTGRLLRSGSLDELPQLWNVLRGDMSLVGPRPLPLAYVPRYSAEQARRLDVLPGITGWAQVHGRNALSWPDKLALDVWYVDHRSTWLDVKIMLLTLRAVAARKGVSADGHATMPEFMPAPPA